MAVVSSTVSAGEVLELIASGVARTRSALSHATGLSRSTVSERLDALFDANLVREDSESRPSGGRPSKVLSLNHESRLILAADIGEDHLRLVVTDLAGTVLIETVHAMAVSAGAEAVVGWIAAEGKRLVARLDRDMSEVAGIGLSVPAPVDYARGAIAAPSVMAGWEGIEIEALMRRTLDVPVIVENDVNARGMGEYLLAWSSHDQVFYVKAGTGIGSAIISGATLFRGAQGAAGDIGHIRLEPESGPLCRCGSIGCVEALAAGWSLVRDLRERGFNVSDTREVMDLVGRGSPEAIQLLREAGRTLGRAIAYGVNLLNPSLVVVGGSLSAGGEYLLMGVRESIYQYSHPLATRDLQVAAGRGDERCGAIGVAQLVIGRALQVDRINALLKAAAS